MNKNSLPMVTYCVPAHDVRTISDYETYDYVTPEIFYPSASAEYYYTDPTDDPDFCDIIADLAQNELYYDASWGPSAVALPVGSEHNPVSAVSIAVPEDYVCPYDEKGIVIAANAVDAMAEEDFKMKCLSWEGVEDISEDPVIMKKKLRQDQKTRRHHAVQRLKEKRLLKKNKQVAKSSEGGVGSSSTPITQHERKPQPSAVVTARQAAAAHRERVKGKFKQTKTRWIAVTQFLHQTHLHDHDHRLDGQEAGDTGGVSTGQRAYGYGAGTS